MDSNAKSEDVILVLKDPETKKEFNDRIAQERKKNKEKYDRVYIPAKAEFDLENKRLDDKVAAFNARNNESGKSVAESVPEDSKPTPPSRSGALSACEFDSLDAKPRVNKRSSFKQNKIFKFFTSKSKSKSERYRRN